MRIKNQLAVMALACVIASPCLAAISAQVPVGPRGIAMGGAYSALAEDASAIFWNPAGLAGIGHQEIAGSYANLYAADIKDSYLAFVLPVSLRQAAAIDWYHSGFDDSELQFSENRFDLSYGYRFHRLISLGASAKYLDRGTSLDGSNVRRGGGVGLDLGLLSSPARGLHLALVDQDMLDTKVYYSGEGQGNSVAYPHNVRFGAAYDVNRFATAAMDVDDRVHVGVELRPLDAVALRAGYQVDRSGVREHAWSFGAGFQAGIFHADYAYVTHPALDPTSYVGLSMAFSFNPSRVKIEKVEPDEIYASLYKSYGECPIGRVVLRNLENQALSVRLKTFIPGLMDEPTEREVLLPAGSSQEEPLNVVLSQKIMERQENLPIQVKVTTAYQSGHLPRTDSRTKGTVAYMPGLIDWGRGVEQAAAFITPQDAIVDELARSATRSAVAAEEDQLANRNLRHAAALFEALGVMGVSYVPDPLNPFSQVSERPHAVDTVHYPRETLTDRAGDCDDLSVLMAALLANVGIPTMFVDVPGHLFLLVDTGLHERHRFALGLADNLYTVQNSEVWIPLETTDVGKSFTEAWKRGAEEYATWSERDKALVVDVAAAQLQYRPSDAPVREVRLSPPDAVVLASKTREDATELASWRADHLQARYGAVSRMTAPSATARNELSRVYFLAGDLARAAAELDEILAGNPGSPLADNNLGVVRATAGEIAEAIERCERASRADPGDGGIWLNLGLLRYVSGDSTEARVALAQGVSRSGGYDRACNLLGLQEGSRPKEKESGKLTAEEIRALLAEALARIPAAEADSSATPAPAEPVPPPAKKVENVRAAASRAWSAEDLRSYLYWKE
jgi:tetratricopeptide (TPR) repeat protein